MKAFTPTTVGTIAAGLGLALAITAAPLLAQPQSARGQRGPGDAPPAMRGEDGFRGGPRAHHSGHQGPMEMIKGEFVRFWDRPAVTEKLELSETQIELLEQSYTQAQPTIEESTRTMREAGRVLAENLRHEGEGDLDAVNAAIDELTAAQNAAMKAAAAHRTTVQTLLLEEQLDELHQLRRHQARRAGGDLRGKIGEMRNAIRHIAEDGVFSDEERARVMARLENAPEPMRDRVIAAIERAVERVAAGEDIGPALDELPGPPAPRPQALPPLPRERTRDGVGRGEGAPARR